VTNIDLPRSYVASEEDTTRFAALNTEFYHHFLDNATLSPSFMQSSLEALFWQIQIFAMTHPEATGADSHAFTDGLRRMMIRQATPWQYRKHGTLLVFIGKDITLEDYLNEVTYMEGQSHAASLTKDLLRHLAYTEETNRNGGQEWYGLDKSFFSFFNFWAWLKHKRRPEAMVSISHSSVTFHLANCV
jgi:hypothetical protein